jgi:Zn-dependent peptidase ImmA (M78 family)
LHAAHHIPDQLALFTQEPAAGIVFCRGGNGTWIEMHANWFAAALLMPCDVLRDAAAQFDLRHPVGVAALKKMCDVSWQALCIRLETLGIPFVDRAGRAYRD